jgi:hypothetical protein
VQQPIAMSDQPQTDESLLTPTPGETARLIRERSRSKLSAWKRLLPAWAFSVGLHLLVLPLVLGITVAFADSLVVPSIWNDVREEKVGDLPFSLMVEDLDLPVDQVQIAVPLANITKSTTPESEAEFSAPAATASNTARADGESARQYNLGPEIIVCGRLTWASFITTKPEFRMQFKLTTADGSEVPLECNDSTIAYREDNPLDAVKGSDIELTAGAQVTVRGYVNNGKNVALGISWVPSQPKQPQAGSDGKADIEIRGTVTCAATFVSNRVILMQLTVEMTDGTKVTVDCNDKTVYRDLSPFLVGTDANLIGTGVTIQGVLRQGKHVAREVFWMPAQKR